MPKKQRAEFFKTVTLKSYTPYTITDPEQLEQELEQIRAQGYAVESGELQIGLNPSPRRSLIRTASVSTPSAPSPLPGAAWPGDNFQKLQEVVIRTAEEITCELRHPSAHGR